MSMKKILLAKQAPMIGHMPAYANTLSAIVGDIYAGMDVVSRELTGFIPSSMRAPAVERAAVGQAVTYPIAPDQTASDIVPSMTPPSGNDNNIQVGTMAITKARAAKFNFTGEEQRMLNASPGPNFVSVQAMIIAQAFRTLTNEVEADLAAEAAANASRAYGTAGTTPYASDNLVELAQLKKILDDNGAPASGRSAVHTTTAGANLRTVKNITRVNEAGSQMTLRQGELIDLFGFSNKETGQPVTHTAGDGDSATTNAAGYSVGDTVITLASAGTGAILAGDVITFAGDANKYIVESGDADVSGGGTITLAKPGLREAIPASATAITVSDDYEAATVGFSQDALHLAARLPARPTTGDLAVDVMTVTDPRTGVSFEIAIYPGYRMMYGEVGLAWGVHASKQAHIGMVLG